MMKNLPNVWRVLQLGQIVKSIDGGISITASDRAAIPGEHGVLTLSAVSYGSFDPRANKAVSNVDTTNLGRSVRARTVLISRSNTIELVGACVFVERDFPHLHLPDLIWEMSLEAGRFDPQWFYYALSSSYCRAQIQSRATGTSGSMKKLSMASLRTVEVPIPPFAEQQAIARVLQIWDRGIRQLSDLIAAKLRFKQRLMQQLLTGRRRFPEFKGEWLNVPLGKLVVGRKELRTPSDDCPLYSLTIEDGITPKTERYDRQALVRDKESKKYKVVHPSDIVFNPSNLRWGAIGISRESHSVVVSPIYEVIHLINGNEVDKGYLFQALSSPQQIAKFATMCEGTLIERMAVKLPTFLACHILFPPSIDEQQRIAEVLGACDSEIAILRKELDALKTQKKGLMQKLLTGQVRVKVAPELKEQGPKP